LSASSPANSDTAIEVFVSYAHKDEQFRLEMDEHLSVLERQGLIRCWYDGDIRPGTEWDETIKTRLESAPIILLLISASFISSDYCYGIELQRAMERHEANEARVVPVIIREVDWTRAPFAASMGGRELPDQRQLHATRQRESPRRTADSGPS